MKTATVLFLAMLAGGASAEGTSAPPPDAPQMAGDCMHGGPGGHHRKGHHGKGRHMQKLQEELGLDDAKSAEVEKVFRAHRDKHRAEREARMQAMHAELRGELAKVLTPEQLAKFDGMHEERMRKRAEWRERRQERREGAPAQ